jgi:hypothetical protein
LVRLGDPPRSVGRVLLALTGAGTLLAACSTPSTTTTPPLPTDWKTVTYLGIGIDVPSSWTVKPWLSNCDTRFRRPRDTERPPLPGDHDGSGGGGPGFPPVLRITSKCSSADHQRDDDLCRHSATEGDMREGRRDDRQDVGDASLQGVHDLDLGGRLVVVPWRGPGDSDPDPRFDPHRSMR